MAALPMEGDVVEPGDGEALSGVGGSDEAALCMIISLVRVKRYYETYLSIASRSTPLRAPR